MLMDVKSVTRTILLTFRVVVGLVVVVVIVSVRTIRKEKQHAHQMLSLGQKTMNFGFLISMYRTLYTRYTTQWWIKSNLLVENYLAVGFPAWTKQTTIRWEDRFEVWYYRWNVSLEQHWNYCSDQMWYDICFVSIWHTEMPICYHPKKELDLPGRK